VSDPKNRLLELDAYVTGELSDTAADALEEAMFDAPDDLDVAVLDRIARHGHHLAVHGTFDMGITRADFEARIARGESMHVSIAGAPNGGDAEPRKTSVSESKAFTVTVLETGITGHERIDAEIDMIDVGTKMTIRDGVIDPVDGRIYSLCERPLAMIAFGAGKTRVKVRRRDGAKEVLAEYFLVGQLVP
jgi:hypothetical protein